MKRLTIEEELNPSLKAGQFMVDFGNSVILYNRDIKHTKNGYIRCVHIDVTINQLSPIDFVRFKDFMLRKFGKIILNGEMFYAKGFLWIYNKLFRMHLNLVDIYRYEYGRDYFNYRIPDNIKYKFIETLENKGYRITTISCLLKHLRELKKNQVFRIHTLGQNCVGMTYQILDENDLASNIKMDIYSWYDIFKEH